MRRKLPKTFEQEKITMEDALALQMELEDQQLEEWRKNMQSLRDKTKEK